MSETFVFFGEALAEPKKNKSRAHLKEIKLHKKSLGKQALPLRHQNPVEAAISSKTKLSWANKEAIL